MNFKTDVDLFPYNTFGMKATARELIAITTTEELQQLVGERDLTRDTLVLGGGSNILFTRDVDRLVVKIEIRGIETVKEDDDHVWLTVGGGECWHDVVLYCVKNNWGGIENLSLIPGTAGAAPLQNIGAYGCEIKEVIETVEAVRVSDGSTRLFSNAECEFGYRDSIFKQREKGKFIISSITLRLTKKNHRLNVSYQAVLETMKQLGHLNPSIQGISEAVIHIRKSKLPDPSVVGNAGSFFKNPTLSIEKFKTLKEKFPGVPSYPGEEGSIKIPAAWLIEQCGWKGKTFDRIGVHPHQALVLVNYGGGKGEEIKQLATRIQQSVHEKFDVLLHPEVNII